MIAGSSQNLATPAAPTLTARTAGSNETALSAAAEIYVNVTALNYFGETIKSAQANVTPTATQVVDVQIAPVAGAQQYNIYMYTSSGTPYLMAGTSVQSGVTYTGSQTANSVGGLRFTLQGATPTSTNHVAARFMGGHRDWRGEQPDGSGSSPSCPACRTPAPGPYAKCRVPESSNVWQGGYINQSVWHPPASTNAVFTALDGLWENNGMNNVTPGVYRWTCPRSSLTAATWMRLANDILNQGSGPQLPSEHPPRTRSPG